MTWDPEALTEICNHTIAETNARDPRVFPWGLFAYADAPGAIGGGVGGFQWFNELQEVLAFISDLGAAGYVTFDDEADWQELRGCLRHIAATYDTDPAQAIRFFNQELTSLLQINWIGRWDDLVSGVGDYPEMVRAHFRDDWDDTPTPTSIDAINDGEQDAFAAFLRGYGQG
jgi:hypothetical protein